MNIIHFSENYLFYFFAFMLLWLCKGGLYW